MCELFAANSPRPLTLNAPLTTFFGDSCMHPHGWGLATRDEGGRLDLRKGPERATDSALLAETLASPVSTTHALGHIRYATAGHLSYDNSHPFAGEDVTGRTWALIHNGSIFHQELVEGYGKAARGQSDSERVFLFLLDRLDEAELAGHDSDEELFATLSRAVAELSAGNKLNLALDDGTFTYIHTNTEDDTLYWASEGDGILVCTRPLDGEGWAPVPKRRLIALRNGRVMGISPADSKLYHFDEEELSTFMLAHAA